MSFSRHRKYRLPTKTKTHAMCPRRVRMTIVGFVRFLLIREPFQTLEKERLLSCCLSKICCQVGLRLTQDSAKYTYRVCNPCGRIIRNLGQLYQFVKKVACATTSTPVKASKRALDTPEKASLSWRKSKSVRMNSPADYRSYIVYFEANTRQPRLKVSPSLFV